MDQHLPSHLHMHLHVLTPHTTLMCETEALLITIASRCKLDQSQMDRPDMLARSGGDITRYQIGLVIARMSVEVCMYNVRKSLQNPSTISFLNQAMTKPPYVSYADV